MIADLLISTHLDDAVWSATGLIGDETTVVTICAGVPENGTPPHPWGDTQAGFKSGHEAMLIRRGEDLEASILLGFTPVHLDVLDTAYGMERDLEAGMEQAFDLYRGGIIAGPLGLDHYDHRAVASSLKFAANRFDEVWLYEDQPYAKLRRNMGMVRKARSHFSICESYQPSLRHKEPAVRAYKSQVRPNTHMKEILGSERYWKL